MPMALTLLMMAFPASGPTDVSPVDTITSSVVGYWLSLGATGIISAVLFWLYIWPGKQAAKIRAEGRADVLEENQRLREQLAATEARGAAALAKAEDQRDEALSIAQERIVPLLANFVAVSGGLTPLLQQIVAMQPLLLQLLNRPDRNPLFHPPQSSATARRPPCRAAMTRTRPA